MSGFVNPTFSAGEIANVAGMDCRLYEFTRQGFTWFYTNAEQDVFFNENDYMAYAISDAGLKQKNEAITDNLDITVPTTTPVVQFFIGTPPADAIKLVMRQMQLGDSEAPIMWLGYITAVKIKDEIVSTITCSTQGTTLRRKGLRLQYSRECPHTLYDGQCRAVPSAHGEVATLTGLDGNGFTFELTAPNPATGVYTTRFTGGFFTWQSGAENEFVEQRGILNHVDTGTGVGGCLVLGQTDGLTIGMTVTLYPGCQKTPNYCLGYFNNIGNYGGYPFLPGRSPFDGDPVFIPLTGTLGAALAAGLSYLFC
jgi:hypothetical protein